MRIVYLCIVLVLLLGQACRTVKKQTQVQLERHLESETSNWSWQKYDSAGSWWQYQSDSPFYYHPDKGLYGYGGRLMMSETDLQRKQWQHQDSLSLYSLEKYEQAENSSEPLKRSKYNYWTTSVLLVLLLALIAGRSYFRRISNRNT